MTDASSDSDDSAGRAQDWEVVSLSTLSVAGSTGGVCSCEVCTSAMEGGAGSGRSRGSVGEGGPQAHFLSNHFGVAGDDHRRSPMLDQFLGSEGESRTVVDGDEGVRQDEVPMEEDLDGNRNENNDEKPGVDMDVEEPHLSEGAPSDVDIGKQEQDEGASGENYSPEMDWIEPTTPTTPNSSNLMREESDVGSNSRMVYDMACEKKPSSESDNRETAGPLLGSCISAPSSAAIVSSVAAFRAGLGEDTVQSPMGGEESTITSNCVVEEELAGLEREILGTDSGFSSFHESPVVNTKTLGLDDRHSALTDALLGEGVDDQSSCEAWWKRRAALWFVEARQANTLWSLALAAAVMGLVILGQRWQHERCQNNHLRLQLCSKDEVNGIGKGRRACTISCSISTIFKDTALALEELFVPCASYLRSAQVAPVSENKWQPFPEDFGFFLDESKLYMWRLPQVHVALAMRSTESFISGILNYI